MYLAEDVNIEIHIVHMYVNIWMHVIIYSF